MFLQLWLTDRRHGPWRRVSFCIHPCWRVELMDDAFEPGCHHECTHDIRIHGPCWRPTNTTLCIDPLMYFALISFICFQFYVCKNLRDYLICFQLILVSILRRISIFVFDKYRNTEKNNSAQWLKRSWKVVNYLLVISLRYYNYFSIKVVNWLV